MLAGPTASGKSAVAVWLASMTGGEVVSVDSMQVYRGLDIGTAKPSLAELAKVRHHLVDIVDPDAVFDVAQFRVVAVEAIRGVHARGRLPILCGGSGLHFKALLCGLDDLPRAGAALRAELAATPLPALVAELEREDPVGAARVDLHNGRRVRRAVELLRLTGRSIAEVRRRWKQPTEGKAGILFLLERDRGDLHARIDARVERMMAAGLVEETRRLLEHGLGSHSTALQAIGYRQVVEHLRGERDLRATVAQIQLRTRQLAKRQMTWFRHQLPTHPVGVAPDEPPEKTAARIWQRWQAAGGAFEGTADVPERVADVPRDD